MQAISKVTPSCVNLVGMKDPTVPSSTSTIMPVDVSRITPTSTDVPNVGSVRILPPTFEQVSLRSLIDSQSRILRLVLDTPENILIRQEIIEQIQLWERALLESARPSSDEQEAQQSNSSGSENEEELEDHDELFVAHNDLTVIPETQEETILEFQQNAMAMYQDLYVSNDGYAMQDGISWIGNNPQDHPGMIQVFLGHIGALDIVGNELPRLVYVSCEKRPSFQHHKRASAMNALISISVVLTNGPFLLNLDYDHYINNIFLCFTTSYYLQKQIGFFCFKFVGNTILVSFVLEGFCAPRRLEHCKIENKSASSGSYIASANRNTTNQQPVAFSPWKPTYPDHAVGIQKQKSQLMNFLDMETKNKSPLAVVIYGFGGIGKTTLATVVIGDLDLRNYNYSGVQMQEDSSRNVIKSM
ncbi:hypothetical protein SUGI_0699320 [Cryptomeria japonica]|nr:hypothetical protein SUGI_0699320 [Cryptomeria japonica]